MILRSNAEETQCHANRNMGGMKEKENKGKKTVECGMVIFSNLELRKPHPNGCCNKERNNYGLSKLSSRVCLFVCVCIPVLI